MLFRRKQKVRQPESPHRKTQTPIVAKQNLQSTKKTLHLQQAEFAFLLILIAENEKGYKPPIKIASFRFVLHIKFCLANLFYHKIIDL